MTGTPPTARHPRHCRPSSLITVGPSTSNLPTPTTRSQAGSWGARRQQLSADSHNPSSSQSVANPAMTRHFIRRRSALLASSLGLPFKAAARHVPPVYLPTVTADDHDASPAPSWTLADEGFSGRRSLRKEKVSGLCRGGAVLAGHRRFLLGGARSAGPIVENHDRGRGDQADR